MSTLAKTSWGFTPELSREIDKFFSDSTDSTLTLPISFYPTEGIATYTKDGVYHVETSIPGMTREDLAVTYNDYDGYLTVNGKAVTRGTSKQVKKTVYIGEGLDDKLMNARLKDGILDVYFPQTDTTKKVSDNNKTIKVS